jgi:hypothetical protein
MAVMTLQRAMKWTAGATGLAALGWTGYAANQWRRYGRAVTPAAAESDPLLDAFMPTYDVVERHHVDVAAPAALVLGVARDADLMSSPLTRAIFRSREWLLGSEPDGAARPTGLLALTETLGWRVLATVPDREIVVGAATRPWEANPVFEPIAAPFFAGFDEPGYVKILWTLRADPLSPDASVFRSETRAVATDPVARDKFRRYWMWLSPGIVLIRRRMMAAVKGEAERLHAAQ